MGKAKAGGCLSLPNPEPVEAVVKNPPASVGEAGDMDLTPGLGRYCGEGNGNSPQYSCLENPKDRGAWRATVHGVAKSWTWLNMHTHKHPEYPGA